MALFIMEK